MTHRSLEGNLSCNLKTNGHKMCELLQILRMNDNLDMQLLEL